MDGVERVMVLGILAVIVAILSFAWNATSDDPAKAVVGGLPGRSLAPLSSTSPVHQGVVIPPPSLDDRLGDPQGVRERQELIRNQLLGKAPEPGRGGPLAGGNPVGGSADRSAQADLPRGSVQRIAEKQPPLPLVATALPAAPGADGGADRGADTFAGDAALQDEPLLAADAPLRTEILLPVALRQEGELERRAASFELYTVREGDTLWGIAFRARGAEDVQTMIARIEQLNPGLDASSLSIGRTIKLPVAGAAPPVTAPPAERAAAEGGRVYVVQEGDSLGSIADSELGAEGRWKDIYDLNRSILDDPAHIRPGQRLLLPEA